MAIIIVEKRLPIMMTKINQLLIKRQITASSIIIGALFVLSHQIIMTSATSCHIISARPAFYPIAKQSHSRRQHNSSKAAPATNVVQTVGLRKKSKSKMIELDDDFDYNYNQQSEIQAQEPSLEELRSQLGPIGLLVSNTIELTIGTVGSFISGWLLGAIGGGIMSIPSTLAGKSMGSFGQRLGALNAKALASGKSWGTLSAAFSGFNNFVRMCRGELDDGWNSVIGSGLTGAFLSRNAGRQAMFQAAATYAGFTYFLDKMTRSPEKSQMQSELMYTDVPVDDM